MKREAFDYYRVAGVCLSILAVFIIVSDQLIKFNTENTLGNLAILAAAFCGGSSAVFYRPYLKRYPTVQVGTLAMVAAAVSLIPFAWMENNWQSLTEGPVFGGVAFIGISSAIGYICWLIALKLIDASKAALLLNLSPVVALGLGVAFLDERMSLQIWVGILCMSIGVWLALKHSQTK